MKIFFTFQASDFEQLCASDDRELLKTDKTGDNIKNRDHEIYQPNIENDWNLCKYSSLLVDLANQVSQIYLSTEYQIFILFVTSNHHITNFVFPIFSTNFSQLQQLRKKTETGIFLSFGP